MPNDDNVIRRKTDDADNQINKRARNFDLDSADRFRSFRGKYPREGYNKEETNPLTVPKDERKAPPLRGS